MSWVMTQISRALPAPRVIYDREGGTAYLSRWYLIGARRTPDPELKGQFLDESRGERTWPFNLFLHSFHRSDDDGALHSHPWSWAVSLILASGYDEERRVGDGVLRRRVRPFTLNFLRGDTYHRVDLIDGRECWSLFLVGPKRSTWYFWDRVRKARCEWRSYILALRGQAETTPWEPDSRESEVSP